VAEQSLTVARSSGDITPEWLSGALGLGVSNPVTGLDLSPVGTGQYAAVPQPNSTSAPTHQTPGGCHAGAARRCRRADISLPATGPPDR
jgi:hypothetical protein